MRTDGPDKLDGLHKEGFTRACANVSLPGPSSPPGLSVGGAQAEEPENIGANSDAARNKVLRGTFSGEGSPPSFGGGASPLDYPTPRAVPGARTAGGATAERGRMKTDARNRPRSDGGAEHSVYPAPGFQRSDAGAAEAHDG